MRSGKSFNASPFFPQRIFTTLSLFKTVSQGGKITKCIYLKLQNVFVSIAKHISIKLQNASPLFPLRIFTTLSLFKTVSQGGKLLDDLKDIFIFSSLIFQFFLLQYFNISQPFEGSVLSTTRNCRTSSASPTSSLVTLPG